MPYIEPFLKTINKDINAVKRVLELPCEDEPTVIAEMAGGALLGLAWGLVTPDPKEVYHKVTGQSLIHDIRGLVLENKYAQKALGKPVSRILGKGVGLADRATFYMFLFFSASSGLLAATSQILRMADCKASDDPNYGSGDWYPSAIKDDGTWGGIDCAINQRGSKFYPVQNGSLLAAPHRTVICSISAQFATFTDIPCGTNSRIIREDTGAYLDYDANGIGEEGSDYATHTFYKSKSQFAQETRISQQFQYDGLPLPLNEAFPIAGTVNGYFYC